MDRNNPILDGLQAYLEEVQVILETTRKPFVILNSDMKVLAANQRFYKTFNLTSEDALGMCLYALDNNEWDIPALHVLLESDLPRETAVDDFEIDHIFTRLGRKSLRINAQFHKHATISQQLTLLSIEDFTRRKLMEEQLKESEERFRRMFEVSRDGLLLINKDSGVIKSSNQAIAEMLGVNLSELIEKPFVATGIWGKIDDFRKISEALDVNGFLPRQDKLLNKKENIEFDAEIFLVNRASLIQCNVRDITERRKAEEERHKLRSQLIQAQKMESVGRLAGGVAHDYNNMLSVITGYAELALNKVGPEDALYADLLEILDAAKRSGNITRQLLAFARQQTIAPKVLDLNDTVESMRKILGRLIGEDIDLAWYPKVDLWRVKIDPTQIDQILANLSVNARDAITDVGRITIQTDMVTFDEAYCALHAGFVPGEFVMLAVSDDGCGMDKEVLNHVFEPFFTTKGVGRGTGLGLATVYGIVKQNDGFINVYSEPGKGTIVKIYLPKHSGEAAADNRLIVEGIPKGRGEMVLVVEDEPLILKLAERMLTNLGYRVLRASTPAEALELAQVHIGDISLVMTDVVLPEMNGRELAERLQALGPKLKFLFMSGYTADVVAHRGILESGVDFLQKPFSNQDLAIKIRLALD